MTLQALLMDFWELWLGKMSSKQIVLGIDTSCYTTSVAMLDLEGNLLADKRQILKVKAGGCGLAQSEIVFQHTRNLPSLMAGLDFTGGELVAIGATNQPRPLAESYMPAFLTGFGLAQNIGHVTGAKVYPLSHQENHLQAGLWSAQGPQSKKFLMLHASGGTTDILLVTVGEEGQVTLLPVGESIDLHAGQFVDRVGVALGLPFPAGPHLEELATRAEKPLELPVWVKGNQVSFSGVCTKATRLAATHIDKAALALGTEKVLGVALGKVLRNICVLHEVSDVILVGGVCANKYIRQVITALLNTQQITVYVPDNKYSGDGAVGAAYYALQQVRESK